MKIRKISKLRCMFAVLAIALLSTLTACATPATSETANAAAALPPSTTASVSVPVVPIDPAQAPAIAAGQSTDIDGAECKVDADCEIKDVGNCCGYYPACVGKDTPVDPEGVKAQCQAKGMMGVCGFPAIESCQCTAGKCSSSDSQGRSRNIIPLEQ